VDHTVASESTVHDHEGMVKVEYLYISVLYFI